MSVIDYKRGENGLDSEDEGELQRCQKEANVKNGAAAEAASPSEGAADQQPTTVEQKKEAGNMAFKKAQMLKRTTASRQYLNDARCAYIEAIRQLGAEPADQRALDLAVTLHTNLAAVHLLESPPRYELAKAATEIALHVNPKYVKALYRRAQAFLEDNREGLPEENLRAAMDSLNTVLELEPSNPQAKAEAKRVKRRIDAIEEARKVPEPEEIVKRISTGLRDRGASCLLKHRYVWGQTEEVVHVFVPAYGVRVTKASDAIVEVKPNFLRIVLPGPEGKDPFELKGALLKPVRPDDCSWQLEDGGLILHVELAKRDATMGPAEEHWERVWAGHLDCKVPSPEEQKAIRQLQAASKLPEQKPTHPGAEETIRKLREMCPGVDVSWGDTSLDAFRD